MLKFLSVETTLGIDLASQPAKTALCVIAWHSDRAELLALACGSWNGTPLHDKLLATSCRGLWGLEGDAGWGDAGRPTKVGIDAPLGWPEPFLDALDAHRRLQPWPSALDNSRAQFERRATDFFVHQRAKKLPLSVTTDRIAYPAMRCAVILGDLAQHLPAELLLRDGSGLIAEVYPDAALRLWLPDVWAATSRNSYKGATHRAQARRTFITESLIDRLGDRVAITDEQRRLLRDVRPTSVSSRGCERAGRDVRFLL